MHFITEEPQKLWHEHTEVTHTVVASSSFLSLESPYILTEDLTRHAFLTRVFHLWHVTVARRFVGTAVEMQALNRKYQRRKQNPESPGQPVKTFRLLLEVL